MLAERDRRITQRAPKACQECTRRKVRCNKTVPCSRCVRLRKDCFREEVVTTKLTARIAAGEEAALLRRLLRVLAQENGATDARALIEDRLSEAAEETSDGVSKRTETMEPGNPYPRTLLAVRTLESQVWSRQSASCYPHRGGCGCARYRGYTELVSINCDMSSPMIQWMSSFVDPALYLQPAEARRVVEFHVGHLWWHHNALHASTFLNQCNIFWDTGQISHPLWLALYISVISSTLWTLVNSPVHRQLIDINFSQDVIAKQFHELLRILYAHDFLSNPSMYSLQAIVISTRYAHNIGFSDSVTNLLASAVGLAQAMGLHRIKSGETGSDELATAPYAQIERENGKRIWWQLVVQDYFAIPFTESYLINRGHFTTLIPVNCNDDMLEQPTDAVTISTYTRCVSQECLLMPEAFDEFLVIRASHQHLQSHVSGMGKRMKELVSSFPKEFLGKHRESTRPGPVWLATARRTLAISIPDKIIMLHRPLLLPAFRTTSFPEVKQTCLAAALSLLRENEAAASAVEETLSIWTQSAFCTTAAVVLGLELLYGQTGPDSRHEEYLAIMRGAAERLERRRCDVMAAKCARLIHALVLAHDDLAVSEQLTSTSERVRMADQIIHDQRLLSQVLPAAAPETDLFLDTTSSSWTLDNNTFDFNVWYNEIFSQFS